jgi:endonuclease/exonuclease/phosphatase family metal-dependent hydrolase
VKLVQLNAWGGRLEHQVTDLLRDEAATFVCLQEIISTAGDGVLCVPLEQLQTALGQVNAYMSPVISFSLMNHKASYGNAILSELPFAAKKTIFTNLTYKDDFDFDSDDYNIRNLQHVQVGIDGKTLNILNHHGHHIRQHKNGDAQTLRQMQQIADYIELLDGPVILSGDFNLAPHSPSLEILNANLRNLSIEHKLTTTRTLLTAKKEVCDYIFVSDGIKVSNFRASDKLASDHQALVLEFEV